MNVAACELGYTPVVQDIYKLVAQAIDQMRKADALLAKEA